MRTINIEWDVDGNDEILCDLPTEMKIPYGMTDKEKNF